MDANQLLEAEMEIEAPRKRSLMELAGLENPDAPPRRPASRPQKSPESPSRRPAREESFDDPIGTAGVEEPTTIDTSDDDFFDYSQEGTPPAHPYVRLTLRGVAEVEGAVAEWQRTLH